MRRSSRRAASKKQTVPFKMRRFDLEASEDKKADITLECDESNIEILEQPKELKKVQLTEVSPVD